MYSLYRAWLSLENLPILTPQLTTPVNIPDVNLQVGPSLTQFSAHKSVLSNHSGFFKAALMNNSGSTPIIVSNVNVDEFSSLLTFMYTGFLDLNMTNIYNILLATHILHMPKALEICRNFLLHSQNSEYLHRNNIIKPIASRKVLLPTTEIFPPNNTLNSLKKSEDTSFKVVENHRNAGIIGKASTSKLESPTEKEEPKKSVEKPEKPNKRISKEKFVIDIACCDGPVRFHRVHNKNYGIPINENTFETNEKQRTEINRNAALNKVMNENIQQKMDDSENGEQIFTCLYCNHTFKSQYCFQKHARRHLNPVQNEPAKREVQLLDMNVQYYPCKSCGCKFPSYYFVHKHRKVCHPEEMADNSDKNNEMLPEESNNSSNNTDVDVVAIHTDNN